MSSSAGFYVFGVSSDPLFDPGFRSPSELGDVASLPYPKRQHNYYGALNPGVEIGSFNDTPSSDTKLKYHQDFGTGSYIECYPAVQFSNQSGYSSPSRATLSSGLASQSSSSLNDSQLNSAGLSISRNSVLHNGHHKPAPRGRPELESVSFNNQWDFIPGPITQASRAPNTSQPFLSRFIFDSSASTIDYDPSTDDSTVPHANEGGSRSFSIATPDSDSFGRPFPSSNVQPDPGFRPHFQSPDVGSDWSCEAMFEDFEQNQTRFIADSKSRLVDQCLFQRHDEVTPR
ncbi:hypothetical protein BKA64DRAFT_645269 [Cadophora sp. MPI-SDFR-AT-0126]|nr:hypothetical protein BKA64DRAFT_645269 [Leotiomycetes sp. MPI-SDFR-AT-0126]